MNQSEKRIFLIRSLLNENPEYAHMKIPSDTEGQKMLLRGLMNVRMSEPANEDFLKIQDAYLQEETKEKHITELSELTHIQDGIYLWQGDITALKCDAIVNAANSGMTGCYVPNHRCIDNCIHTYAGIQLRLECTDIMKKQGFSEPTGRAKITKAYNLPCKYILHTVGPIVSGILTEKHKKLLASCYESCLTLADEYGIKSIAFCCISTGEFHFPNDEAAGIAVRTVNEYRQKTGSTMEVIFNVFKELDKEIYRNILG